MKITMKNKPLLILLLLALSMLSGCWDDNQPERMLYINGIAVDYKDGQFEVYAQIINFANIAKSDQPPGDQPQAEVGFAKGATMDEAFFELYHSVDQKIFWGHFSYLVVSEEVMNNVKLSPIIDSFIRYRETRYHIWVYTTKDPVQELLLVRPVLNKAITLSKLGDPENSFKQESFIEPVNIRKLIINMNEPSHEAFIPLIRVEENWKSIKESIKAPIISGVGVVTPDGFKGFIEEDEVRGMQWMSNEVERGEVTFQTEDGNDITMNISNLKAKVDPIVETGIVRFDIEVKLDATISLIEGDVSVEEIEQGTEKEIEKQIKDTYEAALKKDIDIYRLSEQLYRKNLKAWKQYQKKGKVDLDEDSIRKLSITIVKLKSERKSIRETIEQ
ncbi:Ger(x)C family spore germination protein [Sporosarcina sp. Sa2YVA2]|uniref:Ger(X)C family spore germination protein n=1 Tax=Sporosarcina quadrami TaxID=2762234 RepID=A0ABR8UAF0_9BACL|nr:Ger(x)C family spore germination protein [Sporosarcina quadrami]MBD7984998.1 Ger(x)C family spore germination protein [Sporosarcina quadrami]